MKWWQINNDNGLKLSFLGILVYLLPFIYTFYFGSLEDSAPTDLIFYFYTTFMTIGSLLFAYGNIKEIRLLWLTKITSKKILAVFMTVFTLIILFIFYSLFFLL